MQLQVVPRLWTTTEPASTVRGKRVVINPPFIFTGPKLCVLSEALRRPSAVVLDGVNNNNALEASTTKASSRANGHHLNFWGLLWVKGKEDCEVFWELLF
ncbi:MAG: hypothetical protein JWP00_2289 [Chloroflexi bacterium]|nr:hypothetical protein [Chloroflexota bacterium]